MAFTGLIRPGRGKGGKGKAGRERKERGEKGMKEGAGKGDARGKKRKGQGTGQKECRPGRLSSVRPASRAAVTCSPAFAVPSAPGFNFSVRDGKRWSPRAVPALVFYFSGTRPSGPPLAAPAQSARGVVSPKEDFRKRNAIRDATTASLWQVPCPGLRTLYVLGRPPPTSASAAARGLSFSGVSGLLVPLG